MALSRYANRIGMAAHNEKIDYQEYVKSIQGQAHPRDLKLAQLRALMGDKAYQEWYERNQYTRPISKWEALIDSTIAQYSEIQLIKGKYACPEACPLTASSIAAHTPQGASSVLGLAELAEKRGYRVIRVERKAA